ncbi:MAG: PAS domain S-box protein [Thaumarchaeota archaeon]|nr:PAS domain S-box protein [Nitrososphaerota archaeon]MDE1842690.1 PAS domain S-box protein [Nitrososphaerota archaeon]
MTPHIQEIEDPKKVLQIGVNLIESAKNEVLVMLSTAMAFHRQEKMGLIDLLQKISHEKKISIRILTPKDDSIKKLVDKINSDESRFHIRFIVPDLQSKISILIVDRAYSLIVELKDDSKAASYDAIGTSTYTDSKATVLSYISIFESLWNVLELHENIKESNKKLVKSNLQLSMAEKKYRNLYDHSPSMLRSITSDGILIDCNHIYAKSLGYIKEEAIGMSIYDHTAEDSISDLQNHMEKWKKTQHVSQMELWMKKKDGIIFPALIIGTTLYDENGKLIGRTAAITNLTDIHKARLQLQEREILMKKQFEELQILNKKLETQDRVQKEFINIAAHELRTPIQPIIGLAEALRDKEGEISSQVILIDTIIESGKRLKRLAENILDVTKIESDTLQIQKESINLKELLYDMFQDFYYRLQSNYKEKEIKLKLDVNTDVLVMADRARLTQVLMNLFNNAITFTDYGMITISVEKNNDHVSIRVRDSGIGIDDSVLPQLFTKFVTYSKTGTGLGLFISKSIIEAHGGNMWAENNKDGKGSTFGFFIPVK